MWLEIAIFSPERIMFAKMASLHKWHFFSVSFLRRFPVLCPACCVFVAGWGVNLPFLFALPLSYWETV